MPKPKANMHAEDVKAAVRKKGVSLASLARKNGLSDSAVRKALYGPIPRGNQVIARHLGKTVHEIWPEWFGEDGTRVTRPKDNRHSGGAASQKAKAA
jgi:Ner family transcriptional regulator